MLIRTRDMHPGNETFLDLITHGMADYLDVLRSLMEDRIGRNVHSRFIITEELSIGGNLDIQASKKQLKP